VLFNIGEGISSGVEVSFEILGVRFGVLIFGIEMATRDRFQGHSPGPSVTDSNNEVDTTKDGWLNRYIASTNSPPNFNWRLNHVTIKDGSFNLYKPPSDLAVSYFDQNLPIEFNRPTTPTSTTSTTNQAQHKRILSSSTSTNTIQKTLTASSSTSSTTAGAPQFNINSFGGAGSSSTAAVGTPSTLGPTATASLARHHSISYKGLDPHPDLDYDGRGRIIGGTDEAICHTVLFGDSDEFAKTTILLLPLLSDIVTGFDIMTEYANMTQPSRSQSQAKALVERLQLVVETVLLNFPGMLLDTAIFSSLLQLIESISHLDDLVTNDLKKSVTLKQKEMMSILSYATHQEPKFWSAQPSIMNNMSERLRGFLNKVEVSQSQHASGSNKQPITTVPPDSFLELSTDTLSSQIFYFHLAFSRDWSPTSDISLLFTTKYSYHRHSPLVFDSTNIHFLGSLLLDHLFGEHKRVDAVYRGKLITHWINLGNALKGCGDMVGWLAIATVLCSVPVMRLRDTWSHVSGDLRDRVVKEWAPVVFDLERRLMIADMSRKCTYHVLAPQGIGMTYPKERVVPFFGDLCVKYEEGSTYRQCEGRLNRIRTAFERWVSYLDQIPQNDTFDSPPEPIPALQKLLYALLAHHYETPVKSPDMILKMSLNVEPASSGSYLKHHYIQRSPLNTGSYLPLIFTESNSSYKLFSKSVLVAASGVMNHPPPKRSIRGSSSIRGNDAFGTDRGGGNNSSGLGASIGGSMRHGSASGQSINSISSNASTTSLNLNGNNNAGSSATAAAAAAAATATTGTALQRSNSFPPTSNQQATMTTGYRDLDFSSRKFVTMHNSRHMLMNVIRDVLNVDTKVYHVNDDIVLKSLGEKSASRPSSVIENPKHVNNSFARQVSSQLGNGNSPRNSGAVTDGNAVGRAIERGVPPQINVVVKAANLERLVDILVLGVNEFGRFVPESEVADKVQPDSGEIPQFKIDMDINTLTFFATFRSFCSPIQLLESLRQRFLGARSAAVSITKKRNGIEDEDVEEGCEPEPFPNWEPHCDGPPEDIDWKVVAQIQIGVLEACHLWISQYFGDFVNDLAVRDQFLDLLKLFESDFVNWQEALVIKDEYKNYLRSIESLHKKVRKMFIKKSYRPYDVRPLLPKTSTGYITEPMQQGLFYKLEQFIEEVNVIVSEYFALVQLNDWMELFEVLEEQSADVTGFFSYKTPSISHDEDVVVQDIFTYFETLYRETPDEKVIALLPSTIQDLFRLHQNVVDYVTCQVCDPNVSKDERIARMCTILKSLGIMKFRMKEVDLFPNDDTSNDDEAVSPGISTNVPGFLESAYIAAVLRPESRMFANSWIQAAKEINRQFGAGTFTSGPVNSVEPFIPTITNEQLQLEISHKPLTPCIGWVVERLLEIVCYVPNMSVENPSLINFDKRRYVYNFLTNISYMKAFSEGVEAAWSKEGWENVCARHKKFAFLVNPDKTLYTLEKRIIKDASAKELKEYPKSSSKNKVFGMLVSAEVDKHRRDHRQYEALEKQSKELRRMANSKQKSSSVSGASSSSASTLASARKSSRSRFGGILKAVRPISMAFSGSFTNVPVDKPVHPSELPDLSTLSDGRSKLQLSLALPDCEISTITGNTIGGIRVRGGLFKVVGKDGTEYIFQTIEEKDAEDWVATAVAAKKKAIFKAQISPSYTKVFGVPIAIVCEREGRKVPKVVDVLLSEVEARGLKEVGVYRIPGSVASVNALKNAFDNGQDVSMNDDRWYDINTVAGCFKLYLRELPEPLLTADLFSEFMACGGGNNGHVSLRRLVNCINKLPSPNFHLLKRLTQHLSMVTEYGDVNRMHAVNLAIVFSMSFLPSSSATASVSNDLGAIQSILKALILNYNKIFGDEEIEDESTGEEEVDAIAIHDGTNKDSGENTNSTNDRPYSRVIASPSPEPVTPEGESNSNGESFNDKNRDSFTEVSAY
jgi:hypothetical protein